jgi:hypothetical protein
VYRDKEKAKEAAKERMRRYRDKKGVTGRNAKGVTKDVTPEENVIPDVTPCENCSRLESEILVLKSRLSAQVDKSGDLMKQVAKLQTNAIRTKKGKGVSNEKKRDGEYERICMHGLGYCRLCHVV